MVVVQVDQPDLAAVGAHQSHVSGNDRGQLVGPVVVEFQENFFLLFCGQSGLAKLGVNFFKIDMMRCPCLVSSHLPGCRSTRSSSAHRSGSTPAC
jgi:hypothetical protein